MTFKRNIPPKVFGVDHVEYIEPIRHLLKNGVELFTMNSGDQEVLKSICRLKRGVGMAIQDWTVQWQLQCFRREPTTTRHLKLPIYSTFTERSFLLLLPMITII